MKRNDKPPRVAVYARFGLIQQMFASNGDMVRHLFKELLADGQEHSAKEINAHIYEKTNGRSVDGDRLTEETIHSAIWYMFRHDHDLSYYQTRKGYYQKNTVENLLGYNTGSLRVAAITALSDVGLIISDNFSLSGLSEQERRELLPIRKAIIKEISTAMNAIESDNLGHEVMTANNLEINENDGLVIIDDYINAYIGSWFDVEKRFRLELEGTDEYVNLYANYYPSDERLDVFYIHYDSDGGEIAEKPVSDLTDDEKDIILQLMKDAGLDELVAEMNEDQDTGMTMQ